MAKNRNLSIEVNSDRNLPEEVATKYDMLSNHNAGLYHYNGHKVLLNEINLQQADDLVKNGFPYLVLKQVKEDSSV